MRCPCGFGWMSSSPQRTSSVVTDLLLEPWVRDEVDPVDTDAQSSNIRRKLLLDDEDPVATKSHWWAHWACYWDVLFTVSEHLLLAIVSHYMPGLHPTTAQHNVTQDNRGSGGNKLAVNILELLSSHVSHLFTMSSDSISYVCLIICINDFFHKLSYLELNMSLFYR